VKKPLTIEEFRKSELLFLILSSLGRGYCFFIRYYKNSNKDRDVGETGMQVYLFLPQKTKIYVLPEVSNSQSHHNVIKNLIRMRDLPRIQICNKLLFPKKAILEWINIQTFPKKALTDKAHADISTSRKNRKLKIHR
jgi:hypothetical protein